VRYEWKTASTLVVPFGAEHQHFNTGQTAARYFSAMSAHLEHMCGDLADPPAPGSEAAPAPT
jgi:hypothetical protein